MIYVTTSIWLMIAVLLAWGIHHVWSGIAKPKTVNAVLLPGTLVAQLGHVLGLLITGATVNKTALMQEDDRGEPSTDPTPKPKLPVIGPVIVALLPTVALGAMIYFAIVRLGLPVVEKMPQALIASELPRSLSAFWDQLRALITLAEGTLNAIASADDVQWRIAVFTYLMICLTVRIAPMPGNVRGHVGAVLTVCILAWLAGTLSADLPEMIKRAWPLLSLTIGWLLLLMMITLIVRGTVTTLQMILRLDR